MSLKMSLILFNHAVPPVVTTVQPLPIVVSTTATLMCNVTEGGDAPYTITWTFDSTGNVVYTGNEMTGAFYTFMVMSTDYGTYTCRVMNEFGTSSSTIEVIQAGKNKQCDH